MPARSTPRTSAGLGLALVILGGVAAVAYRSIDAAVDTLGRVERTHRTLEQVGELNAAYARAVAARRVYVVADDPSQLKDIGDLDARLAGSVEAVRVSFADNPAQLDRLGLLTLLMKGRVESLDAAIQRRRLEGTATETSDGLALTARIRATRETIEAEENRLLEERNALTRTDLVRTKVTEVAGTMASFSILLFAFSRLRSEAQRRKQSEQALRASEGFLDSIFENIPDMILVKEAKELRLQRVNRAAEELLGAKRHELKGKNDFDFFPREKAEARVARDRAVLETRVLVDAVEETLPTKRGERWLYTRRVPVLDEEGAPSFLLFISEDITERKQVEAALKEAKDAAEAANLELEAFSYSVAHDLRAPLRAIHGFSQALEEDCSETLNAEGLSHLKRVRTAARHMAELIDGLLSLSRLSRGDLRREPVDLSKLANSTLAQLRQAHPERTVETVVLDGLVVNGDARLLPAVLDNLLGNAWKFTGKTDTPRIEVGRWTGDGRSAFFVRDNGAGFEQAYAHKLFGAFQRLHAVTDFEGSGIGLATVQRIVRRHGGQVWAEGHVGLGATFYFSLEPPAARREPAALAAPAKDARDVV